MSQSSKIIVMAVALSLFALFVGAMNVCAQPFGMTSAQAQQRPEQKVLASGNGRFVFGQISDSSKDQFMLDTHSGRLWRIAESGEVGIFLRAVPYRTEGGKYAPLPEHVSVSEPKEAEKK